MSKLVTKNPSGTETAAAAAAAAANPSLGEKFSAWRRNGTFQKYFFVYCCVTPGIIGYLLFTLYPNIMSVYYSFIEWDGLQPMVFVGIDNYKKMITDEFMWSSLLNNLWLMLVVPVSVIILSVFFADLLVTRNFKENEFYKVLFFFPNILSSVVIGLLWNFIYNGDWGILNAIIGLFGIDMNRFYWLGQENLALGCVMVPMIWSAVGFYMIIFMNGMRSIPKSLYESAEMDGISNTKRLFKITLPLISSLMRVAAIFLGLGALKSFELIMLMTQGGPNGATRPIAMYMFNFAFGGTRTGGSQGTNYGYASTIGMFLFVILLIVKLLVDKFLPDEKIEF